MAASMTTLFAAGLLVAGVATQGDKEKDKGARRLKPGDAVPEFTVKTLDGKDKTLADLRGEKKDKVVVVSFWSHACPWSRGWDPELSKIAKEYGSKNVVVVGIDSNKSGHSDGTNTDSATDIARYAKEQSLAFSVYTDADHRVANAFGGQTTPDVFVIGTDGKVLYTGRVDDMTNPKGAEKVEKRYLRNALDAITTGKPVAEAVTPPSGCSIKRAKVGS